MEFGIRKRLICTPNNNNNNCFEFEEERIMIEKRKFYSYELKSWPSFYAGWKRRDLRTKRRVRFDGKFLLEVLARWWHASYLRIPDSWPPTWKDRLPVRLEGSQYFFHDEMKKRFREKNSGVRAALFDILIPFSLRGITNNSTRFQASI